MSAALRFFVCHGKFYQISGVTNVKNGVFVRCCREETHDLAKAS